MIPLEEYNNINRYQKQKCTLKNCEAVMFFKNAIARWNPVTAVIRSPMGQTNLAVLTRVFFQENVRLFCRTAKGAVIMR